MQFSYIQDLRDVNMPDVFTPQKRSWVMSRIRSRNTGIEKKMCGMLRKNKIHYNRYPKVYGSPDFLVENRTFVFCDGDFWHGYQYYAKKKPPKRFWRDKLEGNMRRDRAVTRKLRADGWHVVRLWEHDINKKPEKCVRKIRRSMVSKPNKL